MTEGFGAPPTIYGRVLVRRKTDGKIKVDMPDGTTRFLTDEEYEEHVRTLNQGQEQDT